MEILKTALSLLFTILIGSGVGYIIAYYANDELIIGRKYFKIVFSAGLVLGVIFIFYNLPVGLSLIFISIIAFVSLYKSKDKEFVKRRI